MHFHFFQTNNWTVDTTCTSITADEIPTVDGSVTGVMEAYIARTPDANNYGAMTGASITNSGTVKTATLNVTGKSTLTGAVTAGNSLSVAGTSTLTGAVTAGSTLYVGGITRLGTSTSTYKLNVGGDIYSSATIRGTTLQLSGLGYSSSDKRLKNIHGEYNIGLDDISKIPIVSYDMKEDEEHKETIGTVAQDVQELVPEIVTEDDKGYLALDYSRLSLISLKGVQLLIKEIQELKQEIKELKEKGGE